MNERAPRNRNLAPPEAYAGIFAEALATLPGAETPTEDVRKRQFAIRPSVRPETRLLTTPASATISSRAATSPGSCS